MNYFSVVAASEPELGVHVPVLPADVPEHPAPPLLQVDQLPGGPVLHQQAVIYFCCCLQMHH